MTKQRDPIAIVREVGRIKFEGNVTPHSWYKHLRHDGGKPNLVAITLLSELVYWYRPVVERDEATGRVTNIRKKFSGDKYRTSYGQMGERFGFTRRQTQDAINFLAEKGVITKEVRDRVQTGEAMHGNVLFLEICPDRLREISDLEVDAEGPSYDRTYEGHTVERTSLIQSNVQASYDRTYDISETPTETPIGGGKHPAPKSAPREQQRTAAAPKRTDQQEQVIRSLGKLGVYRRNAETAVDSGVIVFSDQMLQALTEWHAWKLKDGRLNPAAWLNKYLPQGMVPDDMREIEPERVEYVIIERENQPYLQVPKNIYYADPSRFEGRVVGC